MKNKNFIVLILLLFFTGGEANSQDPLFSQYFINQIHLNPAFTGNAGPRVISSYRNHWADINAKYVTYNASYDQPSDFLHGGIGVHLINDRQGGGVYNNFTVDFMYAYRLKMTYYSELRAGFQASWNQKSIVTNDMKLPDMYVDGEGFILSNNENTGNINRGYFDVGLGFLFDIKNFRNNSRFLFGGAVHHIKQTYLSQYQTIPRKYSMHFFADIPVFYDRFGKETINTLPHFLYLYQGNYHILNYGNLFKLEQKYNIGISFQHDLQFFFKTLVFHIGYVADNYQVHYSYDFQLPKKNVILSSLGSHEISIWIDWQYNNNKKIIK